MTERCDDVLWQLSPYIDGALSPDEMQGITRHVATCTSCARALEELKSADRLVVDEYGRAVAGEREQANRARTLQALHAAGAPAWAKPRRARAPLWRWAGVLVPVAAAVVIVLRVQPWSEGTREVLRTATDATPLPETTAAAPGPAGTTETARVTTRSAPPAVGMPVPVHDEEFPAAATPAEQQALPETQAHVSDAPERVVEWRDGRADSAGGKSLSLRGGRAEESVHLTTPVAAAPRAKETADALAGDASAAAEYRIRGDDLFARAVRTTNASEARRTYREAADMYLLALRTDSSAAQVDTARLFNALRLSTTPPP